LWPKFEGVKKYLYLNRKRNLYGNIKCSDVESDGGILEMELASNMYTGMIYGTRINLFMIQNCMILLKYQNQIFFGINSLQGCNYLVYFCPLISYEIL
jgi:hypothetical protein